MNDLMPWFRCWNDMISDVKISAIADELDKDYHGVLGIWVMILCLASQSPIRGKLYVTFQKRFTLRGIARSLKITEEETNIWMNAFIDMDMVKLENGVFSVVNWEKRQFKSDYSSERVKKYRQKQQGNVSETLPSVSVSVSDSLINNNIYRLYEQEIGVITPAIAEQMELIETDYPVNWVEEAIHISARNNKRSWSYVEAILKRWKVDGFQSDHRGNGKDKSSEITKNPDGSLNV